jgi:hypothetical protein
MQALGVALWPHLTPQGQIPRGLVNPSKFGLEVLFDMGAWLL